MMKHTRTIVEKRKAAAKKMIRYLALREMASFDNTYREEQVMK